MTQPHSPEAGTYTDDFAYGLDAARDLAASNPNDAIRNADSHEYDAENDPFLP